MRNQLEYIHAIDKYLRGVLSEEDTKVFENRLQTDSTLRQEVKKQEILMEAIERKALKASAVKGKRRFRKIKIIKGVTLFVILSAVVAFTVFQYGSPETEKSIPASKELGVESLPNQRFQIDVSHDTVIETENGLVLAIPSDAFENENGESVSGVIKFEVKEAFEDYDIMKAGLTTTSDGELLETGGMFFLEASQGMNQLKLKKGKEILSQIPNLQPDKDMMLFDGVEQEDGIINWVNPKPFEKDLITVDITALDFYPEDYLKELQRKDQETDYKKLGYRYPVIDSVVSVDDSISFGRREENNSVYNFNKGYSDSIYYSFSRLFDCDDTREKLDNIVGEKDTSYTLSTTSSDSDVMLLWLESGDNIKISKSYYDNNEKKVKDSLFKIYKCKLNILRARCNKKLLSNSYENSCPSPSGINPAKVKAIWNEKFNNTILATKEFEQRMRVIHESRQDWILEIYLSNLDKPLWYSDSLAMGWELTTKKFRAFYEEKKGGVKVNDQLVGRLTSYFNRKHKEYSASSSKAYATYQAKKNKLRKEFTKKKSEHLQKEYNRKAKVFLEEYEMNLCEAYRQLDKKGGCKDRPVLNLKRAAKLTSRISTLGAKNVDVYVAKATRDRTTLDYTDPKTGKRAVIKYESMKVVLSNTESFDKVFMYLLPNNLKSFNRMKTTDNVNFELALNELLTYKLVGLAYKDEQAYVAEIISVTPKTYTLNLTPVSEEELKKVLSNKTTQIKEEIEEDKDFYLEEMNYDKQKKKVKQDEELTLRIGKFLFPEVREWCIMPRDTEPAILEVPVSSTWEIESEN